MTDISVSVVVVSHARPDDLRLCLLGLDQLYYPNFEIVVVADKKSAVVVQEFDGITLVPFEDNNISTARNLGASSACGQIVAYIDDDAVPEPTWLDHLVAVFGSPDVAAAGGYIIGRNGISLQWSAQSVDEFGWSHDVESIGDAPRLLKADDKGNAIRTP